MWVGIAAGAAAGALWGLVFVAPLMVPGISVVDFTAGRFVSYGAIALLLMLLAKNNWPTWRQAGFALLMSFLGFTGYYLLLALAIRDAGSAIPSLIIGTIPVWMMILGKPLGLSWRSLLPGLLLTAIGLGLMMFSSQSTIFNADHVTQAPHFWRGCAYAFLAMLCWTGFGILNAQWLAKHPGVTATTWANWLGVATGLSALLMWLIIGTEAKSLIAAENIGRAAILFVATGVGSAWLATILWNIASQRLPASLCGQLIVSETIFALAYSFAWSGHGPKGLEVLACALFLAGILVSIRMHR